MKSLRFYALYKFVVVIDVEYEYAMTAVTEIVPDTGNSDIQITFVLCVC